MNNYEPSLKACWYAFVGMLISILIGAMLTSCTTTKYVTVEKIKNDTTYITKFQRDSIWLHDSIKVTEKGDTIKIEKWHTKYVEKEVHDTLYQSKTDSIPVPYPVEKYVEKKLSWFQQTLINMGWVLMILIGAALVYVVIKLYKTFKPL